MSGVFESNRAAAWGTYLVCAITALVPPMKVAAAQAAAPGAGTASAATRQLGTVKTIAGNTLTITTAAGAPVSVVLTSTTSVLQLPAGSTDPKMATPGAAADISVGDRILAVGKPGEDAATINAARIYLMKSSDIAARNQAQQADWQRRGISGLVRSVDGEVFTIGAGQRTVKVQTTSATVFRRYAADSVKFEDTKPGSLAQIHVNDQLTVRGAHSDDGSAVTAEEVVSGTFANLSGVLSAVDPAAGTVTLKDLATKRSVTVAVTGNSDLRALPPQAAAMFAARSSGSSAPAEATAPAARPSGVSGGAGRNDAPAAGAGGARAGMDLSRMLSRLPTEQVSSLKPGEAVMVVASQGAAAEKYTAITLLSGVEQLLSSTQPGAQPITLSPWNLGAPEGAGSAQ